MGQREKRKEKLLRLFKTLSPISAFSKQQARQRCAELTPQFVTLALKDMVREGIRVDPSHWIERQVSGNQVTAQPEQERPREKLLASGSETLSDAELLAILIRVGVKGESAIESGKRLAQVVRIVGL